MEFMDGTWKKEICQWDDLLGDSLLNQEVVLEGAVHSIRNMGDVAFVILRRSSILPLIRIVCVLRISL